MQKEDWEKLTFFEQLSNMDGDVERLIRAHHKYLEGKSDTDRGYEYLYHIKKLITLTFMDPKNAQKGYCAIELMDEVDELRKYLEGEYPDDYIRRYWNAYTRAIS